MAETFEESVREAKSKRDDSENEQTLDIDKCPECGRNTHELCHPRNSKLETERHKDAPEKEIVCRIDGIIDSI